MNFNCYPISPESDCCKLVENGGINVLVVFCVFGDEVTKCLFAENNRKILLVGYLLEFSSNQFSGKLGEVFMTISDLSETKKT